jgi:hypothetical protein
MRVDSMMLHNASVFTDILPKMIGMRRSLFIAYRVGRITVDVVDDIVALSRKACLDEFEVHPVTFQVLDLYRCKSPQTPLLLVYSIITDESGNPASPFILS